MHQNYANDDERIVNTIKVLRAVDIAEIGAQRKISRGGFGKGRLYYGIILLGDLPYNGGDEQFPDEAVKDY